jgi:hypothetical protein
MEACLINFNKDDDDEVCLKFCNILKWSATVSGKLLKNCLESTVRYDSISVKVQYYNSVKNIIHLGRRSPKF